MNIEEDIIEFRKLIENGEYIDSSDIIQFINNVEIIVNVLKKYAFKNNKNFALLLHGVQPKGSSASNAMINLRNNKILGYSKNRKK